MNERAVYSEDSFSFNEARNSRFANCVRRITELAKRENSVLEPLALPHLQYFSRLNESAQVEVLSHIEAITHASNELTVDGQSLRSSPRLTQMYLRHMGYRIFDGIWEKIDELDIVDLYGLDNRMIFACMRMLESVSYTLEDLYCRTWMELYHRGQTDIAQQLGKACEEVFQGKHPEYVSMEHLPVHIVVEAGSPQKLQFLDRPKFFLPVYKYEQIIAVMCVHKGAAVVKSSGASMQ